MVTTGQDADAGLRGRFWLQGDPEDKAIPGRLFLPADADPVVELDDALTPLMQETSWTKLPDGREVRKSAPGLEQQRNGQWR
jgi:hypothetical protein